MSIDPRQQDPPAQQLEKRPERFEFSVDEILQAGEIIDFSQQPENTQGSFEARREEQPVSFRDFAYTMKVISEKIDSTYRLCRLIEDEQKELSRAVKKLVALDELSDGFWKVFNFVDSQI
jgi:Mg2+ and Co2+ transporter CorA